MQASDITKRVVAISFIADSCRDKELVPSGVISGRTGVLEEPAAIPGRYVSLHSITRLELMGWPHCAPHPTWAASGWLRLSGTIL